MLDCCAETYPRNSQQFLSLAKAIAESDELVVDVLDAIAIGDAENRNLPEPFRSMVQPAEKEPKEPPGTGKSGSTNPGTGKRGRPPMTADEAENLINWVDGPDGLRLCGSLAACARERGVKGDAFRKQLKTARKIKSQQEKNDDRKKYSRF